MRPSYGMPLGASLSLCHYAYQPGRKTRNPGRGGIVRTLHRTGRTPSLTSRRHIDLVRTSSAICQPV
ncbi:putative leader peptide [Streptomyces subrutilus]|uniref:putative leader peptide n=1 Tax=Streptomyces subrutilus TaxID=36818 RepID=UPI0033F9B1BE